jgi:hypothetical protein
VVEKPVSTPSTVSTVIIPRSSPSLVSKNSNEVQKSPITPSKPCTKQSIAPETPIPSQAIPPRAVPNPQTSPPLPLSKGIPGPTRSVIVQFKSRPIISAVKRVLVDRSTQTDQPIDIDRPLKASDKAFRILTSDKGTGTSAIAALSGNSCTADQSSKLKESRQPESIAPKPSTPKIQSSVVQASSSSRAAYPLTQAQGKSTLGTNQYQHPVHYQPYIAQTRPVQANHGIAVHSRDNPPNFNGNKNGSQIAQSKMPPTPSVKVPTPTGQRKKIDNITITNRMSREQSRQSAVTVSKPVVTQAQSKNPLSHFTTTIKPDRFKSPSTLTASRMGTGQKSTLDRCMDLLKCASKKK